MLFTTPEQRRVRLDFPCAGPFGPLGRPKDIRERLEENSSERQRLRRTAEYNGKRSEVHSKFLLPPFCLPHKLLCVQHRTVAVIDSEYVMPGIKARDIKATAIPAEIDLSTKNILDADALSPGLSLGQ